MFAVVAAVSAAGLLSLASGVSSAMGVQQEPIKVVDGPLHVALFVLAPLWIYYA